MAFTWNDGPCHPFHTTNGAAVGSCLITFMGQLPLYSAANFLTLQPMVCYPTAGRSWGTANAANCLRADITQMKQKDLASTYIV